MRSPHVKWKLAIGRLQQRNILELERHDERTYRVYPLGRHKTEVMWHNFEQDMGGEWSRDEEVTARFGVAKTRIRTRSEPAHRRRIVDHHHIPTPVVSFHQRYIEASGLMRH